MKPKILSLNIFYIYIYLSVVVTYFLANRILEYEKPELIIEFEI